MSISAEGFGTVAKGFLQLAVGTAVGLTTAALASSNDSSSSSSASQDTGPRRSTPGNRLTKEDKGKGRQDSSSMMYYRGQAESGGGGGGGGGGGRSPGGGGERYPQRGAVEEAYRRQESKKDRLKRVAETTLRALRRKSYEYRGEVVDLGKEIKHTIDWTVFYPEGSELVNWKGKPHRDTQGRSEVAVSILNIPTLNAAKVLSNSYRFQNVPAGTRTGVLNFASATQPGGGFLNGAEAQEESLARVSSLSVSLDSKDGKKFYDAHKHNTSPYYSHGMIWSPGVVVFQNDHAEGVRAYEIDVVSCAAVNAGKILEDKQSWQTAGAETEIEGAMKERMGRILYLFELQGVRNVVLGTFGTGVFKNKISEVTRIWAELLVMKDSRFRYSFDRVIFAVTGDSTFAEFKGRFEGWTKQKETARPATGTQASAWWPSQ